MYQSDLIARDCYIIIQGKTFLADLILLGIQGYDIILGMDWLAKYRATIDCKQKTLVVMTPEGERLVWTGKHLDYTIPLISAVKGHKLIQKGCTTFLCAVEVIDTSEVELDNIPIVCEFPEVFQEVPGLPPDQEIEFAIELVPSIAPISKAPYRMAPTELVELKKQLQELSDQVLI